MNKLFIVLAAALVGVSLAGEPIQAAGWTYFDLSTSLPHKSGRILDGTWNDEQDWLVTNGTDLLQVKAGDKSYRVVNRTAEMQSVGMFALDQAAGADGTWFLVGSHDGTQAQDYYFAWAWPEDLVLAVMDNQGISKLELPEATKGSHLSTAFRAGHGIFLVFYEPNKIQTTMYRLDGKNLTAVTVPDWAASTLVSTYQAWNQGHDAVIHDYRGNTVIFNGTDFINGGKDESGYQEYYRAMLTAGPIPRMDLSHMSYGNIPAAYGIASPRDALLMANTLPDGRALLTGYGENGLRLIAAIPAAEDEIGTILLTATRVPNTSAKYTLTAQATGPVTQIRILKNGIGIAKCAAATCRVTVDESGTADRFEAWGDSALGLNWPLTSKALVLRDTAKIQAVNWTGDRQVASWTWLQPSSFLHEREERVSWHVGSTLPYAGMVYQLDYTKRIKLNDGSYGWNFVPKPKEVARTIADLAKQRIEIFAEDGSKPIQTCTIPADKLKAAQETMRKQALTGNVFQPESYFKDCLASISANLVKNPQYPAFPLYGQPVDVRVYAKIYWSQGGKDFVAITPTDSIRFK